MRRRNRRARGRDILVGRSARLAWRKWWRSGKIALLMTKALTIKYCAAPDGVRLAYAETGHGPALVKAANWYTHLELEWQGNAWGPTFRELSQMHRLLRYDVRGTGLSDRFPARVSFELFVDDLETVVDAAGLDRFALLGASQGAAVAIAYALRHPERVTHLVLLNGFARGAAHRHGVGQGPEMVEAMCTMIRQGWGGDDPSFRQIFTTQLMPGGTPEQMGEWNTLERESASPEIAARIFAAVHTEIDLVERLPQVRTPTLVLHCRGDRRVPFEQGRELAAAIPNARFHPVDSENHILLEQDRGFRSALDEIERFLGTVPTRTTRMQRSVTRLASRFGDAMRAIEASTVYKLLAIIAVIATLASVFA